MLKEEKIREAARAAGIEMIGFAEPHPLTEWLEILEKRREQGRITSFERTPPSRRVDYSQAFPKVKGGKPPFPLADAIRFSSRSRCVSAYFPKFFVLWSPWAALRSPPRDSAGRGVRQSP